MLPVTSIPLLVVLAITAVAAVTDVWKFKVYNVLTLPSMLAGLVFHGLTWGWVGLGWSVAGLVAGFLVLFLFHLFGGVGAGDVKLFAAVGAWLGPLWTYYVFLATGLAGGAYALALVLWQGRLHAAMVDTIILWQRLKSRSLPSNSTERITQEVNRTDRRRRLIPYAAMTSVGFVATVLWFSDGRQRPWSPLPHRGQATRAAATPRPVGSSRRLPEAPGPVPVSQTAGA